MMNALAYLMLDGPGVPQDQLKLCVFFPTVAIALAWVLIKWRKWLVIPALVVALLSALVVTAQAFHPITRKEMIDTFGISYVVAIFLSAGFPFLVIAVFYFEERSRANQLPEPMPGSVTAPAGAGSAPPPGMAHR
jgi:hypothetical protein